MSNKPERQKGDPETTGHQWDGIQEFNNPLPAWWLWIFYITIIWGIGYTVLYPAWPGIKNSTAGLLGYSTRAEVADEIARFEEAKAPINARLEAAALTDISSDADLQQYAVSAGEAVFNTWCVQCHGREGGNEAAGYPVLSDDDWLWGGDIEEIHWTIAHGIRNENDADARYSEMPAYGEFMEEQEIAAAVNYVMTLSGAEPVDASLVEQGSEIFADNCAACHAEDGTGDIYQGAPNLTDAIWLYGGDYDTLVETVTYSRFGVMPSWADRLTEAEIRAVSVYVHGLGGGQ